MDRPRIGICTSLEVSSWSVWEQLAALLPYTYITRIQAAGGLALMIAPDPNLIEHPDEVLDLLDGLIMAGGADIHPETYGHESEPETTRTNRQRAILSECPNLPSGWLQGFKGFLTIGGLLGGKHKHTGKWAMRFRHR